MIDGFEFLTAHGWQQLHGDGGNIGDGQISGWDRLAAWRRPWALKRLLKRARRVYPALYVARARVIGTE